MPASCGEETGRPAMFKPAKTTSSIRFASSLPRRKPGRGSAKLMSGRATFSGSSGDRLARSEVEARATLQERLRGNAGLSTGGDWSRRVEERHSIFSNDRSDLTFNHD